MHAIRKGCVITIEKAVFSGSWRNPKYIGNVLMTLLVVRHSYGTVKGQHTFTVEILDTEPNSFGYKKGKIFNIKGRNLYRSVIEHQQGEESKKNERPF